MFKVLVKMMSVAFQLIFGLRTRFGACLCRIAAILELKIGMVLVVTDKTKRSGLPSPQEINLVSET